MVLTTWNIENFTIQYNTTYITVLEMGMIDVLYGGTVVVELKLTIYRPNSLITDLRSVFTGAQPYVILTFCPSSPL